MKALSYALVLSVGFIAWYLATPGPTAVPERSREDIRNACLYSVVLAESRGGYTVNTDPSCNSLTETEREALLSVVAGYLKQAVGA